MTTRVLFVLALLLLAASFLAGSAHADDALVLPKGRFSLAAENFFFFPFSQRYNPNGDPEEIDAPLNRRLDSSVFRALAPLNRLVGGSASIGDSHVRFRYELDILDFRLAYGIADRLTVGVQVPYYFAQNNVRASLDSGPGSSANVGLRTGPGPGPCALASTVLPLTCPNTRRFTTADVQQLLGPGLPGITGFGIKPIRSFSAEGVGDVTLGVKYQYLRTDDWQLAAAGGVRFPTGRQEDPDDLTDFSWSSGAYALLLRLNNDWVVSNLWRERSAARGSSLIPRTGDLVLNLTFRYALVLPDEVTVRVSDDPNSLTMNRARLDRDLGDRFEFETAAQYYTPIPGLALSGLYKYGFKLEDQFSPRRGLATRVLERDTDSSEHIYIVRLSYSTLPLYAENRFPIPMTVGLAYRDRFAGMGPRGSGSPSQVVNTRYISLGLQILF